MKKILTLILLFPCFLFAQQKPNIILILMDDVGNGEVGYNNSDYHTPNIDTLAAKGAKFTRFYTTPSCSPTRASLMTGKTTYKLGLQRGTLYPFEDRGLASTEKTLPEYLKEEGYQTAMIGKWNLGFAYPEQSPNLQGFDHCIYSPIGLDYLTPVSTYCPCYNYIENNERAEYPQGAYLTELEGAEAVEWIEKQAQCEGNPPFFLYLAFHASHTPLVAPQDTINLAPGSFTANEKTKWAMNRIIDNQVGAIMQTLETNGIDSNTIIIVTSDNGGDLTYGGNNAPYYGNKAQMYDGSLRVPFVWYHPGTVTEQTVDSLTCIPDILPTLFEGVLGRTITDTSVDGINFYSLLGGAGSFPANREWTYITNAEHWVSIRGDWKLCNNCDVSQVPSTSGPANIELFDLSSSETVDVSGTNPSIVTELQGYVTTHMADTVAVGTIISSEPGGWVDPPSIMTREAWYNPNYYFYRE